MAAPADAAHDAARIDRFIRRHYGVGGALRLHSHALGWDLLRAPVNVALAPLNLALHVIALLLRGIGARRIGRSLASVTLQLPSDVGRAVAAALERELLAPRRSVARASNLAERRQVRIYLSVRTAVSEITATLAIFGLGAILFEALTPGVFSLSTHVSERAAEALAVTGFPLGESFGALWYGLFPPDRPLWLIAACTALLLVSATLLSAFAGIIADPVQRATGIHRRRLTRLLARIDLAARGEETASLEREHVLARFGDLADAVASLTRFLRP